MKGNELRIGNYVYFKNGLDTVVGTEMDYIMSNHTRRWEKKNIKPIPITKEWLLKFGFTQIYNCTYEIEIDGHVIEFDLRFRKMSVYFGDILLQLKYVHELQNLYFALTSEELTIKE